MVAFDLGMQTNDAVLREVLRVELKDEASCDIGRQISVYVNVPQLYPENSGLSRNRKLFSVAELRSVVVTEDLPTKFLKAQCTAKKLSLTTFHSNRYSVATLTGTYTVNPVKESLFSLAMTAPVLRQCSRPSKLCAVRKCFGCLCSPVLYQGTTLVGP